MKYWLPITILLLVTVAYAAINPIAFCGEHQVRSSFTGNTQWVIVGKSKTRYCEYSHPNKDLKSSHKFWTECEF